MKTFVLAFIGMLWVFYDSILKNYNRREVWYNLGDLTTWKSLHSWI